MSFVVVGGSLFYIGYDFDFCQLVIFWFIGCCIDLYYYSIVS